MVRAKSSGDCNMAANKAPVMAAYSATSPHNIFSSFRIVDSAY
jgi:hypothetical protein